MSFVPLRKTKRTTLSSGQGADTLQLGRKRQSSGSRLSLYLNPPDHSIKLADLEEISFCRNTLLTGLADGHLRGKKGDEYAQFVRQAVGEAEAIKIRPQSGPEQEEDRVRDLTSHYVLRLAYSQSEDLRRWFMKQECELFKHRFEQEGKEGIDAFLKQVARETGRIFKPISKDERDSLNMNARLGNWLDDGEYYKVPFMEVPNLVSQRKVALVGGQALVPRADLVSLLLGLFRSKLSEGLVLIRRTLPFVMEDERIAPLVKYLSNPCIDSSHSDRPKGSITPEQLDDLADHCYPMCMRHLHKSIRAKHHARYFGRMQYGLFIKGIGLTLQHSMVFWKSEFTKKMSHEDFDKKHSYNIRHNYGEEGKRVDYSPWGCSKTD